MEIVTLNCTSCGAPIKIPPEMGSFNCAFCGANLVVKRGEGYVALKLVEQVGKSIKDVGEQTQSTIRESSQVTQIELKRLQLRQDISSLQIQLSTVQSEIRSLQRQKANRGVKQQLKELSREEASLITRIKELQMAVDQSYPTQAPGRSKATKGPREYHDRSISKTSPGSNYCASPLGNGCVTGFLVLMAGSILCGLPAQLLDQAIFNIPMSSSSSGNEISGPIFSISVFFITVAFFVAFAYGVNPKAKIWKSAQDRISKRMGKAGKQEVSQADSVQEGLGVTGSEEQEKPD